MDAASPGVLVVGPPEIAAQIAACLEVAKVFALNDSQMSVSPSLEAATHASRRGRIDVDVPALGARNAVNAAMLRILEQPNRHLS